MSLFTKGLLVEMQMQEATKGSAVSAQEPETKEPLVPPGGGDEAREEWGELRSREL
jgi:hypothetical protein